MLRSNAEVVFDDKRLSVLKAIERHEQALQASKDSMATGLQGADALDDLRDVRRGLVQAGLDEDWQEIRTRLVPLCAHAGIKVADLLVETE